MNAPITRPVARLNVGLDASALASSRSGLRAHIAGLASALAEQPQIDLTLLSHGDETTAWDGPENLSGMRRDVSPTPTHPLLGRALFLQAHLPRRLHALDLDLCHFPNFLVPLGLRLPTVVTIHDLAVLDRPEWFSAKKRWLSRHLIAPSVARADAVIVPSDATRRDVLARLSVPRQRVHVVANAPSSSYRRDAADAPAARARLALGRDYVLVLGSLEHRKNLHRLLAAFASLTDRHPHELVFVGPRGQGAASILAAMRPLAEVGRARYLGYRGDEEVRDLLAGATALAFPSLHEGFGLPIVEAFAMGTPVLCANRGAPAEIGGDAVQSIDPEDTGSIARGLSTLLSSADRRAELRERGLRRVDSFRWEQSAAATVDIYQSLGRSRGPRPFAPPTPTGAVDAVSTAVAYASLFAAPITPTALHHGLPLRLDVAATHSATETLIHRGVVSRAGEWLGPTDQPPIAAEAAQRRSDSRALLARERRLLDLVAALPFVRAVGISGAAAHDNAVADDDLDLFVVTAPGRATTAFAAIALIGHLLGKRDVLCANYLVDDDHVALGPVGDYFTAHQVIHLQPWRRAGASDAAWTRFFRRNGWAFGVFPNAAPRPPLRQGPLPRAHRAAQRLVEWALTPAAPILEPVLREALRRRLVPRTSGAGLRIEPGVLKLHLRDSRAAAVRRFAERLARLRSDRATSSATPAVADVEP